jgi:hypothetical protein
VTSGCTLYFYINGGVKRCVAARGAGEVRMYISTSMAAKSAVLPLEALMRLGCIFLPQWRRKALCCR